VEDNQNTNIPFVAFEAVQSRMERIIKRMWIVIIILIFLLVGSNIAWLIYESQWEEYEETTVTQEANWESGDLIQNGTGEITINGQSETDSNN
jgi:hypothetical protein